MLHPVRGHTVLTPKVTPVRERHPEIGVGSAETVDKRSKGIGDACHTFRIAWREGSISEAIATTMIVNARDHALLGISP